MADINEISQRLWRITILPSSQTLRQIQYICNMKRILPYIIVCGSCWRHEQLTQKTYEACKMWNVIFLHAHTAHYLSSHLPALKLLPGIVSAGICWYLSVLTKC